MTDTPILVLPELASAQAIPEAIVNENTRWLEFFAAGGAIADRGLLDPTPLTPADGDAYLIDGTGAGAWTGKDGQIALYISTAFEFKTPTEGMQLYIKDEDSRIIYDGASWATPAGSSGGATEATASEIWTGTSTSKYISPDKMFDAAAPVALTSTAGSVAVDMATGINFNVAHTENTTIANPSNAKPGQSGRINVVQDAGGTNTLAWGANWTPVGGPFTIDDAADAENVFAYFVNTTTDIEYSYVGVKG